MRLLLAMLVLSTSLTAHAQAPVTLGYAGRLASEEGRPLNATLVLEVSFHYGETGAPAPLAPITFPDVRLSGGAFQLQIELTHEEFHTVFGNGTRAVFLQVTDVTDPAKRKPFPRQRYNHTPMAGVVPVDDATLAFGTNGLLGLKTTNAPAAGQFLSVDGSGQLSWAMPLANEVATQQVTLKDGDTNNVGLKVPSNLPGNYTLTLPGAAPVAGSYLRTDAFGNLTWDAPAGSGNMSTATFDFIGGANNKVDVADTADRLGGELPAYYRDATNLNTGTVAAVLLPNATTTVKGAVELAADGESAAGLVTQSNDSRLSNARVPTGPAGGDLTGTFPNATLNNGVVTGAKIANTTITAANIVAGTITTNEILNGTITGSDIAAGTITAAEIQNNSITGADIATGTTLNVAAVSTSAQAALTLEPAGGSQGETRYKELAGNGGDYVALRAPAAITTTTTFTLPDGAPTLAGRYLTSDASGNLAWAVPTGAGDMLRATYDANSDNVVNDSERLGGQLPAYYRDAGNLNAGVVPAARLPAASTTVSGIVELATDGEAISGVVVQGNDARLSDARTPTGGAGGDLSGTYPAPLVANGAITSAKIAANTILAANIAGGTITSTEIAPNTIVGGDIAPNTITAANIAAGTITSAEIGNGSIAGIDIASGTSLNVASVTTSTQAGLVLDPSGGNQGEIRFKEVAGSEYVALRAPAAVGTNATFTLPDTAPALAGRFLTSDASGNLTWGVPSGAGDMLKATYDATSNNKVDLAENAELLNGEAAAYYRNADNLNNGTVNVARLPVVTTAKGGLGIDASGATGFPRYTAGSVTIGALGTGDVGGLGTVATRNTGNANGNVPLLGAAGLTNGKWCSSDGATVTCDKNPPTGTLTAAKWCTSDGTTVNCTENAPLVFGAQAGPISFGTSDATALALYAGNNERITVLSGGNVGIGETTPTAKLHVAGTTRLAGAVTIVDGTEGTGKVLTSGAAGAGSWQTPSHFGQVCDPGEYLRGFDSSGNKMCAGLKPKFSSLDMGWLQTVTVMSDGTVRGWGHNGAGDLGDGTTTTRAVPVQMFRADGQPLANVSAVATGMHHTCLISQGEVW